MKRFKDFVKLFQILTHNQYQKYVIKENKNLISLLLCQSSKIYPFLPQINSIFVQNHRQSNLILIL